MKNLFKTSRSIVTALSFAVLSLGLIACDSNSQDGPGNILEVAEENGFTTLLAAVDAAGLTDALEGDGPLTVFAPTDAAFEALPEGTLASLLMPENQQALQDILTYHVVSGRVPASDVVNLSSATTLLGQDVSIQVVDGTVFVNGAQVTIVDVQAENGIIHVIDAVLLPQS